MKKFLRILFIVFIIALIWFISYKVYFHFKWWEKTTLNVDINKFNENLATEVVREDMISSVSFVGSTRIKNQQKLKFNYENRVTWVFKQAWDYVKKDELIAELEKTELYTQIEISKLNVENLELKLKKLLENTSEVETKKAQMSLDSLKRDLENTKINLDFFKKEQDSKMVEMQKTLRNKETEYRILQAENKVTLSQLEMTPEEKQQELNKSKNNLVTSELEYEREKRDFDINYSKKETEYYNTIEKKYVDLEQSIRSLNQTFNSLNELLGTLDWLNNWNTDYYIYFSSKNASYKNASGVYLVNAYGQYKIIENKLDSVKNKQDINFLIELVPYLESMYENLVLLWDNLMKWLNESVENDKFSAWIISGFYGQASSLYSDSKSKLMDLKQLPLELKTLKKPDEIKVDMTNELNNKKDQIEDLKISIQKLEDWVILTSITNQDKIDLETKKISDKEKEIEDYKLEIEKAQINNKYELDSKEKGIVDLEIQINEAERTLRDLLDDNSNQELIFAQNELKQARINLENETKKLEQYELRAPFDWIITKLDYQVGDNLIQNDEKYALLENPDMLEVSVFADQVDVMKLSKWQKAIVTYDAFPGTEFEAEIIEIDSTPQDKDWVTKYEVKISLQRWENTIFSWMQAQVNIIIQEKLWVLAVPFSAINTNPETWDIFVVVLNEKQEKEQRSVVTWYSDWNLTEILEWLEEWEKVLWIDYDSNYYAPEDFWDDSSWMYY